MVWETSVSGEPVVVRSTDVRGPCVYLHEFCRESDGAARDVAGASSSMGSDGKPINNAQLGAGVWQQCTQLGCPGFTLVCVGTHRWNDDLSPWPAPSVFKRGEDFGGGAARQLELLETRIAPAADELLGVSPSSRIIAGYSLAGLFAVWSTFNSRLFSGVASASGSLWFPGFVEYAAGHSLAEPLERAYFSLGSQEDNARNKVMALVRERTEEVRAEFDRQGVQTTFVLNPGNHFRDTELRMAKGIAWVLGKGA